jgi:hypothetical protein
VDRFLGAQTTASTMRLAIKWVILTRQKGSKTVDYYAAF